MLKDYLNQARRQKEILLMTHIVIGYPSLEASYEIVKAMVAGGVDLMELQIPFSEPIADGPVILKANQQSLAQGITVGQCLDFAGRVSADFGIPFVVMTYYNILFKFGVKRFAEVLKDRGLRGAIVPDLPPEEGREYLETMQTNGLAPVFIFAPTSSEARMRMIAEHARGFVYCVARKGVTGQQTQFSQELEAYLDRCRQATDLPLALGFGVKNRGDVQFLTGKVDIAVIGTQTIRIIDEQGTGAVEAFITSLR
jgi:tryptophan synthase alpha chain